MFRRTFRITLQNLFRSPLVWLTALLVVGITIYEASILTYGYYDEALNEMIFDTDSRFILRFQNYVQHVSNACTARGLRYQLPLFAIVTTSLILMRDYGDKFFEIERAAGMKPSRYVWGRVTALVTVNTIMTFSQCFLSFYWYVFSRGGVEGMDTLTMLGDSLVRLTRTVTVVTLPAVLFYVAFTYAIGCFCKNWVGASVIGVAYSQFARLARTRLASRLPEVYIKYLMPAPQNSRYFFYYYDTEWHDSMLSDFQVTEWDPIICFSLLLCVILLYLTLSHFCVYRRKL